jgi:CheY-like chemotaxis protein
LVTGTRRCAQPASSDNSKRGSLKSAQAATTLKLAEPDSLELMARVLGESHALVRLAASADEAIAELKRQPAQVLVSDIGMPGKGGYELIREVRAETDAAAMPAIAVTAFARVDDHHRALAAGFQQHLSKPLNPTALLLAIAELTGRA